jgi:hypothetical protein
MDLQVDNETRVCINFTRWTDTCSFYKNNIYYEFGIYTNGLYILEMLRVNINSKKNILDNQYSSYLWYYRLGHINKTRITKLHKEGYLIILITNHMKFMKLVY